MIRLLGVFCVVCTLQASSLEVLLNSPLIYNRPLDKCTSEICKPLLRSINEAKSSIDFAIYGLRKQNEILEAILKAKRRGVRVRGIVDKDIHNENYYTDTEKLISKVGTVRSDYKRDKETAVRLKNKREFVPYCERPNGFEGQLQCVGYSLDNDTCIIASHCARKEIVFQGDIMHNKFFIIDKKIIWTGSTNVSNSGTGGYNANIALLIHDKNLAEFYTTEFEQMYQGDYHRYKKELKKRIWRGIIGGKPVQASFSPQGYTMELLVRDRIREAKRYIDIPVFFLTHKKLAGDLIQAYQRGVKVRIIIDATASKNGYTKHEILRAVGIPVKVEDWGGKMHMKVAVIDDKYLIAGSMNWTSAGESKNDENTLIIKDTHVAKRVHKFFNMLWDSIDDKWLHGRPDPESLDSGTSCSDGVDNDFDRLVDSEDSGCRKNPPKMQELPPYYIVKKEDGHNLIKGNINRKGLRIYHIPKSKWYDKVKINKAKGEKYFCSPYDAIENGWRGSRFH